MMKKNRLPILVLLTIGGEYARTSSGKIFSLEVSGSYPKTRGNLSEDALQKQVSTDYKVLRRLKTFLGLDRLSIKIKKISGREEKDTLGLPESSIRQSVRAIELLLEPEQAKNIKMKIGLV